MGLRFLVVDDDVDNAVALALVIEALGHEACTATNAEDALREAARIRPHAALLDWLMPGTDGIRLAALLQDEWPDLYTVLITGYGGRDLPKPAQAAGIMEHVLKPASMASIEATIDRVRRHVEQRAASDSRAQVSERAPGQADSEAQVRRAKAILHDGSRERWERTRAADELAMAVRRCCEARVEQHWSAGKRRSSR